MNGFTHIEGAEISLHGSRPCKTGCGKIRAATTLFVLVTGILQWGCEFVPSRPEAVFMLYRERMKSGYVAEGRKFLSEESKALALNLTSQFKLEHPPEDSALLNILDPQSSPIVTISEDTFALLQVRTMKGGLRLIRVVRETAKSPWKINIVEELRSFEAFLEAQSALDMMREKAGEYAASWRAFSDQMDRMTVTEEPPGKTQPPKQIKKPKLQKFDKRRKSDTP